MYQCPLCQNPLVIDNKLYRCGQNHCFDIAKEGYVNLLPVQQKNSKAPGDNKEMMQARREFLQAGWYQPLADAVCKLLQPLACQKLLDLGCGEGYYSSKIQQALPECAVYGLDIAKNAIKIAAKANKKIQFCVASAYHLPYSDQAFDTVVRIYAPSTAAELARVMTPSGHLLTVTPGPEHLFEIKQAVYQQPRLHDDAIITIDGFNHQQRQRLSFKLHFNQAADVLALIQMVPLAWKFTAEQKQHFAEQTKTISIDFLLDLYQKRVRVN
ncbi:23S rRNA (guanine(745)-N(1))-methyltransferase [Rheinheimera sp. MMS21-TC3]|uniref:23S rRNA (guanine(745)-N(1))-methyltransferase n=1 Tax=Rheinheimera sp. MMS21-TC3 TaxID=3072790 RepID=UPI0028C49FD4|nr:23S rRNA (guanine(745)-N(1))-methyltransferase [Rheinheimera sp. MMS21-TC3]WNO61643.1 23S rRNA (guanine(745)-N(1))-methyltransferase [Rheinheimera sp. MMS21-TC3]